MRPQFIEKMGREALGARIGKCHKENVSYFGKDGERAQIGENGPGGLAVTAGSGEPAVTASNLLRKWAGRPWSPELANVIKRMCHISVRAGRGPRLGKMGQKALEPRIGKCYKENVSYFSKGWEEAQIGENGPGATGGQDCK